MIAALAASKGPPKISKRTSNGAWSSVESPSAVQVTLGDHLENTLSSSGAGSFQEASKSSKLSPGGVQKASKRLQIAPQSAQLCSKGPQEVPSCSQEAPKRLQVAPKRLQVGSKRRPRDSKLAPRGAQEAPSGLQEAPKRLQVERKRPSRNTWRAPGRLSKSIRRAKRENHDF